MAAFDPRSVFQIKSDRDFEQAALEVFRIQANGVEVYKKYLEQLGCDPNAVTKIESIPFLPIEFFKSYDVVSLTPIKKRSDLFLSSGTTGSDRSKHLVSDISLYEESFRKGFSRVFGAVKNYTIIGLLPAYYSNRNSSLLYMVKDLIQRSGATDGNFYNERDENLKEVINKLLKKKKKVMLIGLPYALMETLAPDEQGGEHLIIIETGGMKGKAKEITREELHEKLKEKFGVRNIYSEYGMTELLSQAWSTGDGEFSTPSWMKILVRDANDPFSYLPQGRTGAINVIDLANYYSCSFIATSDLGRVSKNGNFEVLGRMDFSDLRGCALME